MDRRAFLRTTGAAAAAATTASVASAEAEPTADRGGIAAPAVARGLRQLRLAIAWPDSVSGPADQARRLAQRITAMSEGRYRIDVVPGAGSGFDAVRAGEADLYHGSEHDHLDQHRALAYFAGLPGDRGIAARHLTAWMLVGGGETLWDDLAGDLAGAMTRGDILAAEFGGALTSHSLGLVAAAPYAVGTSINRHGSALSLGMARTLWDGLSATDQAIFTAAAAAELQLALAEDEAHRRLLAPEPSADRTWPLADELHRTICRVADAVVAHLAASDPHAQRINASYTAFRHMVLGDAAIAETV